MSYNVILDELLVAKEDLLPAEDGGLRPGVEGFGAGVDSCQHFPLGSFGNASHHLISGLRSRRQSINLLRAGEVIILYYCRCINSLILIAKYLFYIQV